MDFNKICTQIEIGAWAIVAQVIVLQKPSSKLISRGYVGCLTCPIDCSFVLFGLFFFLLISSHSILDPSSTTVDRSTRSRAQDKLAAIIHSVNEEGIRVDP